MKNRSLSALSLFFLLVLTFGAGFFTARSTGEFNLLGPGDTQPDGLEEEFAPFWEIWNLVDDEFVDQELDNVVLVEGAINGLLATLDDPNTRYLSPEAQESANSQIEGEFQGIGAEVTSDEFGAILIVAPFEGSPAQAAGLQPGDILRAADGVDLTGMDVGDAAGLVRGPAGTQVLLLIERDGEQFEVLVTRDRIQLTSVRGELLEGNIAYIRISRFARTTHDELLETAADLLEDNPSGLIVDLRSNPGGLLSSVLDVADEFLDSGLILTEAYGNGSEDVFRADEQGILQDIRVVVLIDEGSASASEVLAGALRDRERALLIGQTSFGKGTVQAVFTLSNGGGARITTARWLTPDGTWVHEEGITPDIFIPLPDVDAGEEATDTQLQAAIDFLLGRQVESIPPEENGDS